MGLHLITSDAAIRAVKPGDTRNRLTDGGLYLLLFVKGGSHGWRFDYTFEARRNTLSPGTYPSTSLAFARKQAEQWRRMAREGTDPSADRQTQKDNAKEKREAARRINAGLPALNSFEAIAGEWYGKNKPNWAASHSLKIMSRLEKDIFPWIGASPIAELKPTDVLAVLRRVEERAPSKPPTDSNRSPVRSFAMQWPLAARS